MYDVLVSAGNGLRCSADCIAETQAAVTAAAAPSARGASACGPRPAAVSGGHALRDDGGCERRVLARAARGRVAGALTWGGAWGAGHPDRRRVASSPPASQDVSIARRRGGRRGGEAGAGRTGRA